MILRFILCAAALIISSSAPAAPDKAGAARPKVDNSQERICKDITMLGSRLTKKRFCGTRAEWADKQLQDKQETERIQRSACVSKAGCP